MDKNDIIAVRGGGETASGIIHRLVNCGFNVVVIEGENPSEIRRRAAFCEAVFDGETKLEGITCTRVANIDEARLMFTMGKAALIVDDGSDILKAVNPKIYIEASMTNNSGNMDVSFADLTIAVGAGFFAGRDADCVIEAVPGHRLGSVIYSGYAMSGTIKENMGNIVHSPVSGHIVNVCEIGDSVKKGQVLAKIGYTDIISPSNGILRGIVRNNYNVSRGMTIAETASGIYQNECCSTISDRVRCISGSVLEEVVKYINRRRKV